MFFETHNIFYGANSSQIRQCCCELLLALFHCINDSVYVLQIHLHTSMLSEDWMMIVYVQLLSLLYGHVSACCWMFISCCYLSCSMAVSPIACCFELSFVYFIEVLCFLTEPPPFSRKCRKSAVECGHCACVWNARLLRVLAHFIFSLSSHQRNAVVAQCFIIPRANVHVAITQDLSLDHPDLLCL